SSRLLLRSPRSSLFPYTTLFRSEVNMRRAFPVLAATLLAVSAARANEVTFGYDLMEAKKVSARTGLPVMAFFLNGVNTSAGVWRSEERRVGKSGEVGGGRAVRK